MADDIEITAGDTEGLQDLRTPMHRVDRPESPDRCGQAGTYGNQCMYVRVEGTPYCKLHAGNIIKHALERKAVKLYQVAKYRARLDSFADDSNVVASRLIEELAILRMTLEGIVNEGAEVDLVRNAPKIALLVKEVRETLKVDGALKRELGEVLSRAALSKLAASLVTIFQEEIPAERLAAVVDKVAAALAAAVQETR